MKNETVKSNVPKTTIHARNPNERHAKGVVSTLHYHDELELLPVYAGVFACTVDGVDYVAVKREGLEDIVRNDVL